MNYSRRVEANLAEFYELIPNLPKQLRVWLANNAWRIALAGAVWCVVCMFLLIPEFFATLVISSWPGTVLSPMTPYVNTSLGTAWLTSLLSIIVFFATAVMLSISASALRRKTKAGWDGLYRAIMLNIGLGIVALLLEFSWGLLASAIVGALVTGYVLFEIRPEFHYAVRPQSSHVIPE